MIYEEEAYLYGDEIENEEEDTDPNGVNINALCLFTPEDGVGLDPTTAYVVPLDPFDAPAVKCPSPTAVKCEPFFVSGEAPTVEDRAARSFYEDPVNLDAVYSRQYIRFLGQWRGVNGSIGWGSRGEFNASLYLSETFRRFAASPQLYPG